MLSLSKKRNSTRSSSGLRGKQSKAGDNDTLGTEQKEDMAEFVSYQYEKLAFDKEKQKDDKEIQLQ